MPCLPGRLRRHRHHLPSRANRPSGATHPAGSPYGHRELHGRGKGHRPALKGLVAVTTFTDHDADACPLRRPLTHRRPSAITLTIDGSRAPPAMTGGHRQCPGSQVECQVAAWLGAADQRAAVGRGIDRVGGIADRTGQQGCLTCMAHAGAA